MERPVLVSPVPVMDDFDVGRILEGMGLAFLLLLLILPLIEWAQAWWDRHRHPR